MIYPAMSLREAIDRCFDGSIQRTAEFLHVSSKTINRWLSGETTIHPAAEKLLYVVARGYLPPDIRFRDIRIDVEKTAIITPNGREIGILELDRLAYIKDEYHAFVNKYGRYPNPPPCDAVVKPYPFRGNRRATGADWIPSNKPGMPAYFKTR